MRMKNIFAITVIIALILAIISGCSGDTAEETSTTGQESVLSETPKDFTELPFEQRPLVKIAVLRGPTGMGAVKLFADNDEEISMNRYEKTIVGSPDEIVGKITTGEIDIAAVPTNLAANLYNKTDGSVRLIAVNTLGVLHILDKGEISEITDLAGKKLYATGKGSTPEYIINYLLIQNGLEPGVDVEIEYKNEHSELMALALSGQADIVMLPEPFVTNVLSRNEGFVKALDLTVEWVDTMTRIGIEDSVLAMGGVIARKDFIRDYPAQLDAFLDEYKESIKFTNNNPGEAGLLIAEYDILPSAELARLAIPNSNIVFIEGNEMKNKISNLYNVFFIAQPRSIGDAIPDEDFYYIR